MRIEHVAIWTRDLARLKAFYETYFGASAGARYENPRKRFESYFLSFGTGARLELMCRPDLGQAPAAEVPPVGYAHLALSVGSREAVDAMAERLRRDGHPVVDGPRQTGDGYYECVALDPDGNRIEVTV
jgi:lactoylglutathione lyase